MRLDLKTQLSIPSLQRSLNAAHPYQVGRGWSPELSEEGLVVDLARVEWVEPSALVQVALLIEACVRRGFDVFLRTPRKEAAEVEKEVLSVVQGTDNPELLGKAKYIVQQIERRRAAAQALSRWRLWSALQAEHILQAKGRITLEEEFDWSVHANINLDAREAIRPETKLTPSQDFIQDQFTYKTIFPLRWIGDPNSDHAKPELTRIGNYDMLNFLSYVLNLPDRGISIPDARTLAHVFLNELAENVARHAGVPYGLLAIWARPPFKMKQEIFDRVMKQTLLFSELEFGRWASAFPMIEVIVGDSGRGIPSVLGPEFVKWSRDAVGAHIHQAVDLAEILGFSSTTKVDLNRNQQIMFWSLDKWSSSVLQGRERGTRGLYRVLRIVRKWEGCLTIRSETDLVGIDCRTQVLGPLFVEKKRLARYPGSVIHLRLPAKSFAQSLVPAPPKPIAELRSTVVDFDSVTDVDTAIEKTIQKVVQLSRAHPSLEQPLVVIVDLRFRPLNRHQLEVLLSRLTQVAHPAALVVANVGEPYWEAIVQIADSIGQTLVPADPVGNGDQQYDPTSIRNALLVVEQSGKAKWVGHQEWLCSLLDKLLQTQELQREFALAELPPARRNDQSLRELAEQWHVIDMLPDGGFRLRFNLADMIEKLHEHLSLNLDKLLREGRPPAVYRNQGQVFLTPSQRLVDSYICLDDLLGDENRHYAMGLLALLVRRALASAGAEQSIISIVTDEGKARGLADSFRDHLGEAEIYPVSAYSKIGRVPAPMPAQRMRQVIIFTDLISTASLVRRLVDRVIQNNLRPSLVACVLDARENPEKHITVDGVEVPVVSLHQVDLSPDMSTLGNRTKILINPVTSRPEVPPIQFTYEISPHRLDAMLIESSAMHFGHIVRSTWRHFTLYLDAMNLLGHNQLHESGKLPKTGEEICAAFERVINRWLQANGLNRIDGILYPQTIEEDRRVPTAAETIARSLGDKYGLAENQVKPMDRKQGTNRFVFGDSKEPSWVNSTESANSGKSGNGIGENLVLLDWGCITGQTGREMTRAAASVGASHALIVFFVSQMPEEEERSLRITKQVQIAGRRSTEITVEFLSRFDTWAYSQNDCPYCEQIRRFSEEDGLDPPPFLRKFVVEARHDLRRKTLEEVRQEQTFQPTVPSSVSAIQLPLEPPVASIVRIGRFRELLRAAESRASERELVCNRILSLVDQSTPSKMTQQLNKPELIRLLATEWTLLARPPLSDNEIQTTLAKTALELAQDSSLPEHVRQSAIIVLRTTSTSTGDFVEHLPHLLLKLLPHPKLAKQLLYCAFTLLKSENISDQRRLPRITESLDKASSNVRQLIGQSADKYSLELLETVNILRDLGLHLWEKTSAGEMQAPAALQHLKLAFGLSYDGHHDLCRPIRGLRQTVLEEAIEDRRADLPEVPWQDLMQLWEQGEQLLQKRVLPFLPPLRRVFLGRYARSKIGIDKANLLTDSNLRQILKQMSTIRTYLHKLVDDPEYIRVSGVWEEFRDARDMLWDVLLSYGGKYTKRSALLEILDGLPVDLKALETLIRNLARPFPLAVHMTGELVGKTVRIFCHEEVLKRCFEELLENVILHRLEKERTGDTEIPVEVYVEKTDEHIIVTIRNQKTASKRATGREQGLVVCRELLEAYDASLEVQSVDPPWTFAVALHFQEA